MISDSAIASLLVSLYSGPGGFDHYEPGCGDSGICWALKRTPEVNVICLRGSATLQDWIRDLMAVAAPWQHAVYGPVHPGFAIGMERAYYQMRLRVPRPWLIAGHSLGAARAAILTAMMLEDGAAPPVARVTFGEPKPGFRALAEFVRGVPARSYRNTGNGHHDLVTSVPISFPPEEYVHSAPLIDVSAPPKPGDPWGAFAYHRMDLYEAALKGLNQ